MTRIDLARLSDLPGPEGPEGPAGPEGPEGPAGPAASVATDAIWDAAGDTVVGTGADTAVKRKNNDGAAVAPTVNEDSGDGYAIGSRWLDTTADKEYVCLDATVGAAVWTETTAAGGSITHAYIGYNSVGASTEGITQYRTFVKKVTLASDGLIESIGVYLDNVTNGAVLLIVAGVWEDNAGSPRYVLAANTAHTWLDHDPGATAGNPRWVHLPIGFWAPAGDYWIGINFDCTTNAYNVYKDGSGADRYFTGSSGRAVDAGQHTVNTTTDRYSIRASLVV